MNDFPRLIEYAFPLKQASLASVHEKNVRHGHISTLHIWPARRPLAACRAALLATLLPDPSADPKPEGMSDAQWEEEIKRRRQELCERIGGKVVQKIEKKKMPNGQVVERIKEEVEGGVLHWIGTEPKSGSKKKKEEHRAMVKHREEELEWFRQRIREVYGDRAPKVLDPFAGGGAIPLEAMRLGCEATAVDINPVAWFILKCTLEYPQKLAGKTQPLPDFIVRDRDFMERFLKDYHNLSGARLKKVLKQLVPDKSDRENPDDPFVGMVAEVDEKNQYLPKNLKDLLEADLAWHVRAWGQWVLREARKELAPYYPTYADFEPLKPGKPYEKQPMQLVPLKDDGTPDIDALNGEFSQEYLDDERNPRWIAKPTVAYFWARTVTCKNCRATIPLLKTRWLCKKSNKRVLLTMKPNADKTGVEFGIQDNVPIEGKNAAQRREHDKRIGSGTMSRAGAQCPCCDAIMTSEDLRAESTATRLGDLCTAVVTSDTKGKRYRLPTAHELAAADHVKDSLDETFAGIPFGVPDEPISAGGSRAGGGSPFTAHLYGFDQWGKLFTPRQLLSMGMFVKHLRRVRVEMAGLKAEKCWIEAVSCYLALQNDKVADYNSQVCVWHLSGEKIGHTFTRFALPITWDFTELAVVNDVGGAYSAQLDWVSRFLAYALEAVMEAEEPRPLSQSAIAVSNRGFDLVVTDPPYYDAIPYSDLMDFFYLWLKRSLYGLAPDLDRAFSPALSPKWDSDTNDGELVDDSSRHDGDNKKSKAVYEDGMARAFERCFDALEPEGKMVMVFAHKQPDAWETLVSALIRSGFVVDGSWPIQTEMSTRMRAKTSAALASSVWLVCKKRPAAARPGWDNQVLEEMRANIARRLRDFWDAGIRGPDFVWAATGPALEAYSKYPVVRRAAPKEGEGPVMEVHEFLVEVRRMVVDYVVGQVLTGEQGSDLAAADRMDSPTAYYLLHRHDFGMDEAPAGACILYATACGLSDHDLDSTWNLLSHGGSKSSKSISDDDDNDNGDSDDGSSSSGSKLKLRTWKSRKHKSMGYEAPGGRPVPLIDRVHRLMHLWKDGDVHKVDEYLDDCGLRRHELFKRLVQSLIELAAAGSDERSLLESLSNHIGARGATTKQVEYMPDAKNWGKEEHE